MRRDGFACVQCGYRGPDLEVDHVVAVEDGGAEDDPANCQTLCTTHHVAKTRRENYMRRLPPAEHRQAEAWYELRESLANETRPRLQHPRPQPQPELPLGN